MPVRYAHLSFVTHTHTHTHVHTHLFNDLVNGVHRDLISHRVSDADAHAVLQQPVVDGDLHT
jgi:hypothetical protein